MIKCKVHTMHLFTWYPGKNYAIIAQYNNILNSVKGLRYAIKYELKTRFAGKINALIFEYFINRVSLFFIVQTISFYSYDPFNYLTLYLSSVINDHNVRIK